MTPQIPSVAPVPPQAARVRSDPEAGGNTGEPRGFLTTLAQTLSVEENGKGLGKKPAGSPSGEDKDDGAKTSQTTTDLASLLLQMIVGGSPARQVTAVDGGREPGPGGVQCVATQDATGRLSGVQILEPQLAVTQPAGTQLAVAQLAGTQVAGIQLAGTQLAGTRPAGSQTDASQTAPVSSPSSGEAIAGIGPGAGHPVDAVMNELVALLKSSNGKLPSLNAQGVVAGSPGGDEQSRASVLPAGAEDSAASGKGGAITDAPRSTSTPAVEVRTQSVEYVKQKMIQIGEQSMQTGDAEPARSGAEVTPFRETEPSAAGNAAEKAEKAPTVQSRGDHGAQGAGKAPAAGSEAQAGVGSAGSTEPGRIPSRAADGPSQSPPSALSPAPSQKGDASSREGTHPDASAPQHKNATAAQAPSHAAAGPEQGDAPGRAQVQTIVTTTTPAPRATERAGEPSLSHAPLSLPPEASREVVDQVIRGLSLHLGESTQEVRLTLKPESLGNVVLQVRMEEGKMQAQIDVTQPSVKAALEGQIADLRLALQQRGIDVQRIDIIAGSPSTGDGNGNHSGRFKQRMSRHTEGPDEHEAPPRSLGYNTLELIM